MSNLTKKKKKKKCPREMKEGMKKKKEKNIK